MFDILELPSVVVTAWEASAELSTADVVAEAAAWESWVRARAAGVVEPVSDVSIVSGLVDARRAECRRVWDQLSAVADLIHAWSPSLPAPVSGVPVMDALVEDAVVDEIALACGWTRSGGWDRVRATTALIIDCRLPLTAALLAAGELDWPKVREIVRSTSALASETGALVEAHAYAHLGGAHAVTGVSMSRLHAALIAAIAAVDAEAHERRVRDARARRGVTVRTGEDGDGTAVITGYTTTEQAAALDAALTDAVREAKAAGDARTEGQLRADTLVDRVTGTTTWTPHDQPRDTDTADPDDPDDPDDPAAADATAAADVKYRV